MTEHLNPQPAASSAVEQAKTAIVAKLEQALAELREVNQSMRGIPCPACAEKDQQILDVMKQCNDEIVRAERLEAALHKIASWGEGKEIDGSFDEPASARIAREALAPAQPQTAPHQD